MPHFSPLICLILKFFFKFCKNLLTILDFNDILGRVGYAPTKNTQSLGDLQTMKKLALLLAMLMLLTVGLFALTACGDENDYGDPDAEVDHGFDNIDDLFEAIVARAQENFDGEHWFELFTNIPLPLSEHPLQAGLTQERYEAEVVDYVNATAFANAQPTRATLMEVRDGRATAVANMIPGQPSLTETTSYNPMWLICVTAVRSFTIRAGNYILVMSGGIEQTDAVIEAFRYYMGAGALNIFHEDPNAGEVENDGGFGMMPGLPDIDGDFNFGEENDYNDNGNGNDNDNDNDNDESVVLGQS